MNRAQATSYLAGQFSELADIAGVVTTDTTSGFGPAIDQSLRKLGYTETQLPTADETANVVAFIALLEVYALKKLQRALAIKYNYSIDGQSHSEEPVFQHLKDMLTEAKETAASAGFTVDGADSWESWRFNLDIYEPSEC